MDIVICYCSRSSFKFMA